MNNDQLDKEFKYLLKIGKTQIDLRYACGEFVTFSLKGHKVISDNSGITVTRIRNYFQSKMEEE